MVKAFSLVELSIVLVILGLLTGGILTGQNLIRAAELRSAVAQLDSYRVAAHTFRDKYLATPGDMRNATDFWGIKGGTTGNDDACYDVEATDSRTCNGGGDGRVEAPDGSAAGLRVEIYLLWQHLANAGLVEGSYTGIVGPGHATRDSVIGWNVPASRISNAGFDLWYKGTINAGDTHLYEGNYGNAILFGSRRLDGGGTDILLGPSLKPDEAWMLDKKLDDGRPGYGKIRPLKSGYLMNSCVTDNTDAAAAHYNLENSSVICLMFALDAF
jgi:prepilin-type N-terminal cleavage/methylation domain-containing protein